MKGKIVSSIFVFFGMGALFKFSVEDLASNVMIPIDGWGIVIMVVFFATGVVAVAMGMIAWVWK